METSATTKKIQDLVYRDEHLQIVENMLQKSMNLEILCTEARGVNGHVISAIARGSEIEEIALKIETGKNVSDGERCIWPGLKHSNILPLLQQDYLPELDMHIYISPFQDLKLDTILREAVFLWSDGLVMAKKWLLETLNAASYLHERNICHLGISARSVLISSDLKAVLSDFYYLGKTDVSANQYGTLKFEMPPEVCQSLEGFDICDTEGTGFDSWSIGMMALKIFTGYYIDTKIPKIFDSWFKEVYQCLFKILQKKVFMKYCRKAFLACKMDVDEETVQLMINFVTSCLRICPSERPYAVELEHHKLLDPTGQLLIADDVWKKKVSCRQLVHKINDWKMATTPTIPQDFENEIFETVCVPTVSQSPSKDISPEQHMIIDNTPPENIEFKTEDISVKEIKIFEQRSAELSSTPSDYATAEIKLKSQNMNNVNILSTSQKTNPKTNDNHTSNEPSPDMIEMDIKSPKDLKYIARRAVFKTENKNKEFSETSTEPTIPISRPPQMKLSKAIFHMSSSSIESSRDENIDLDEETETNRKRLSQIEENSKLSLDVNTDNLILNDKVKQNDQNNDINKTKKNNRKYNSFIHRRLISKRQRDKIISSTDTKFKSPASQQSKDNSGSGKDIKPLSKVMVDDTHANDDEPCNADDEFSENSENTNDFSSERQCQDQITVCNRRKLKIKTKLVTTDNSGENKNICYDSDDKSTGKVSDNSDDFKNPPVTSIKETDETIPNVDELINRYEEETLNSKADADVIKKRTCFGRVRNWLRERATSVRKFCICGAKTPEG